MIENLLAELFAYFLAFIGVALWIVVEDISQKKKTKRKDKKDDR